MSGITNAVTQANNEFNQALSKQKGSTLDKDSFMLLLVTQFKYQDPLNPMDDKEFISQMAQFSSLEQMMNMNDSMKELTDATNNQQMINATSYIGKLVTVTGNTIGKSTEGRVVDADGNVTEKGTTTISTFRYAFGDNVVKGTLSVKDANGNTIYTEDLAGKQAGPTFEFNWSGLTGAGEEAPDGVYTVSLAAFNSKGEAVLSDQVVDATVTGVINNNGTVMLGMNGGQMMELAKVRQVTTPKVVNNPSTDDKNEETPQPTPPETDSGGDGGETEKPGEGDTPLDPDTPSDGGNSGEGSGGSGGETPNPDAGENGPEVEARAA